MNHRHTAAAPQILGAEERNTEVDTNDVWIDPAVGGVKRVGEPISSVDAVAKAARISRNAGRVISG